MSEKKIQKIISDLLDLGGTIEEVMAYLKEQGIAKEQHSLIIKG